MKISDAEAIEKIQNGEIVALATDTLYGLTACFNNEAAIQKIYSLKKRPPFKPLIVLISDIPSMLSLTSDLPDNTLELAYAFWPGPLTLILPANIEVIPDIVRAGNPTCAFRIPANNSLLEILHKTGPIVAPSANLFKAPPANTVQEVEDVFGEDFPVNQNKEKLLGIPSTILSFNDGLWELTREGAITAETFNSVLGYIPTKKKK